MSDKEKRDEDEDKDEDEETGAEASDDETSSDEASDEDRPEPKGSDDEDDEGAAARVAEALGVGEGGEDAESAKAGAPKATRNRAARRREEAIARRRRRASGGKGDDDDELPRDKNARAKELLARRREQAEERRPVQLLPSEMVEDALSRITSSLGKWLRKNFAIVQWGILAAILGTGGLLFYLSRMEARAGATSAALAAAVAADRGRVVAEDKRSDEEKEVDTTRIFKSAEERADAALAAYNKVIDEHGGTGAATLAKLGQAGALLDKKDYKHALEAYSAVQASTLAAADPDVKGRAVEGMGFAKEGMGDADGALAAFKELQGIEAKGYRELGLYHEARIQMQKGDNDKAKELLKSAREKLQAPGTEGHPFQFLEAVVDRTLTKLDPTAVPQRTQLGGPKGSSMTPEEMERLMRKIRENAEKKAGGAPHDAP